jgi:hypothetical protein
MELPATVVDTGERARRERVSGGPCTVCFVVMDPAAPGGVRIATARAPAESLLRSAVEALRHEIGRVERPGTTYDVDAPGEAVADPPARRPAGVPRGGWILPLAALVLPAGLAALALDVPVAWLPPMLLTGAAAILTARRAVADQPQGCADRGCERSPSRRLKETPGGRP